MPAKAQTQQLRASVPADSEKVTVNMGFVDLGHIDLLVAEGFYSNRTDFIRTAVRNQIQTHQEAVKQVVARKMLVLGLQHFTRQQLEGVRASKEKLQLRVLGLASFAPDVSAALALATIESITVMGALHASAEVKKALATRIH